jgi:hypothetical protein
LTDAVFAFKRNDNLTGIKNMKYIVTLAASSLLLTACQQASESAPASAEKDGTTAAAPADGNVCNRYFAFVEDYAGKQQTAVKDTLLKRLDYDKQSLPTRDKADADAYCTQSLERMERMAG